MPDPVAQYVMIYYYNLRIAGTAIAWMWDEIPMHLRDPNVFVIPMPDWYVIMEQDFYEYDPETNTVFDPRIVPEE